LAQFVYSFAQHGRPDIACKGVIASVQAKFSLLMKL